MSLSRRAFLRSAAATAVFGPTIITGSLRAAGQIAANDRLQLGFIGVGTMGRGHVNRFLGQKDVQIVAVCDVVKERTESAQAMVESHYGKQADKADYKGCAVYEDFRELLADKNIDAVLIATPDHWHAVPCVLAAQAKKDIYCEKPLTAFNFEILQLYDYSRVAIPSAETV